MGVVGIGRGRPGILASSPSARPSLGLRLELRTAGAHGLDARRRLGRGHDRGLEGTSIRTGSTVEVAVERL